MDMNENGISWNTIPFITSAALSKVILALIVSTHTRPWGIWIILII